MGETECPVAKSGSPVTKSGSPVTKSGSLVTKSGNPGRPSMGFPQPEWFLAMPMVTTVCNIVVYFTVAQNITINLLSAKYL